MEEDCQYNEYHHHLRRRLSRYILYNKEHTSIEENFSSSHHDWSVCRLGTRDVQFPKQSCIRLFITCEKLNHAMDVGILNYLLFRVPESLHSFSIASILLSVFMAFGSFMSTYDINMHKHVLRRSLNISNVLFRSMGHYLWFYHAGKIVEGAINIRHRVCLIDNYSGET